MAYDSVVIGGGVMGSAVALRLSRAGQKVLVLERSIPGAEASSAAAGILGPQIEGEGDDPLFRLCLASRDAYPAFVEEVEALSGKRVGYHQSGLLRATIAGDDAGPLAHRLGWQREMGLAVEALDGAGARKLEPSLSPEIAAALYFPNEARIDPQLLASALPKAAQAAGATFRSALVQRVVVENGRAAGVEVEGERIPAGAVVVAAGAWTSHVAGCGLPDDAVAPVRGQMAALRLPGLELSRVIFATRGYLVPRGDGLVLVGSTMEQVGYEKKVTAAGLTRILTNAVSVVPALADAELVATWSGLRPCPKDGLPLIGSGAAAGLFLASGHHRNGILLTPETARLLSEAVLEGRDPETLAPFSPLRFGNRVSAAS